MTDFAQDLRERWLPSDEQMKLADTLLAAGYDAERGEHREDGVYTCHLLINKEYGWWGAGIELVFLDGVFLTREAVLNFLQSMGQRYHDKHGVKLTGGWAHHSEVGYAAVWEDIGTIFPVPEWSTRR